MEIESFDFAAGGRHVTGKVMRTLFHPRQVVFTQLDRVGRQFEKPLGEREMDQSYFS